MYKSIKEEVEKRNVKKSRNVEKQKYRNLE